LRAPSLLGRFLRPKSSDAPYSLPLCFWRAPSLLGRFPRPKSSDAPYSFPLCFCRGQRRAKPAAAPVGKHQSPASTYPWRLEIHKCMPDAVSEWGANETTTLVAGAPVFTPPRSARATRVRRGALWRLPDEWLRVSYWYPAPTHTIRVRLMETHFSLRGWTSSIAATSSPTLVRITKGLAFGMKAERPYRSGLKCHVTTWTPPTFFCFSLSRSPPGAQEPATLDLRRSPLDPGLTGLLNAVA
jgi:hypothetical protein